MNQKYFILSLKSLNKGIQAIKQVVIPSKQPKLKKKSIKYWKNITIPKKSILVTRATLHASIDVIFLENSRSFSTHNLPSLKNSNLRRNAFMLRKLETRAVSRQNKARRRPFPVQIQMCPRNWFRSRWNPMETWKVAWFELRHVICLMDALTCSIIFII